MLVRVRASVDVDVVVDSNSSLKRLSLSLSFSGRSLSNEKRENSFFHRLRLINFIRIGILLLFADSIFVYVRVRKGFGFTQCSEWLFHECAVARSLKGAKEETRFKFMTSVTQCLADDTQQVSACSLLRSLSILCARRF